MPEVVIKLLGDTLCLAPQDTIKVCHSGLKGLDRLFLLLLQPLDVTDSPELDVANSKRPVLAISQTDPNAASRQSATAPVLPKA